MGLLWAKKEFLTAFLPHDIIMRRCEFCGDQSPWSQSGVAIIAGDGLALLCKKLGNGINFTEAKRRANNKSVDPKRT